MAQGCISKGKAIQRSDGQLRVKRISELIRDSIGVVVGFAVAWS